MDLPEVEVVALDTETSGLHPDDGARVASVALAWDGGSLALPFDQGVRDKLPAAQLDMLEELGGDPNLGRREWLDLLDWLEGRRLVFHNAKFDLLLMGAGTRHWAGRDLSDRLEWDTMVASAVMEPLASASLDAVARRAGGGGKEGLAQIKDWLSKRGFSRNRYDLAPWYLVEPYVATDAEETWRVYRWQQERVGRQRERVERELQLTGVLLEMERRGVGYDATASLEAADVLERRAYEMERRMPFLCDVNSAKRWFFERQGLRPDRVTDKGNPSLDEEQVRAWVDEGVEWAAEYAEVTKARRAVSMWYRGYPEKIGPDGRLRTTFRQTKVKSGRMSVERVQLQAMPKSDKNLEGVPGVRTLLRPAPGHKLWSLDLSQAELRVAAKYAGCRTMLERLEGGTDFHGETCKDVLGVRPDHPEWKTKRDIAKRLTFGSIFQIGGKTFQATLSKLAGIHLPLEECDALVRGWRSTYPEFTRVYRKAEKVAANQGRVKLLPGTEYEVESWFGERDWPHTAWNRIVQGSLAEFFKLWQLETEREWPGLLVLTIHDSLLLEIPGGMGGKKLAKEIAGVGGAMATDLFGVPMHVDVERW